MPPTLMKIAHNEILIETNAELRLSYQLDDPAQDIAC